MSGIQQEDDLLGRLNLDLWQKVVKKAKPWKAHGPDGLQSFWWKVFSSANAVLYQLILHHITSGEALPQKWITEGRIVLLYKSGPRSVPANYRPIACRNTCYKLLTGFIAAYLDQYVKERQIMPSEQIALQKDVWGCQHAHILDQIMIADAQYQRKRPISVAWIDYTKAFDSVPHSYIKWLLVVMQVPNLIRKLVINIMNMWRVRYEVKGPSGKIERSSYLKIKSGVLQGDSFSPLLFCLAIAPISYAINKTGGGYVMATRKPKGKKIMQTSLSHIFYMDDLKLYANSKQSLDKQKEAVASISRDMNMQLNAKKCAVAHFIPKKLQHEVLVGTHSTKDRNLGFPLLEGAELYKYLGMEQKIGIKESEAWDRVEELCYKKAHQLWNFDLNFRQKVNSFNSAVLPALTYVMSCVAKGSGKYSSVLKRGKRIDVKFRKILTKHKARYKSCCAGRIYLPVDKGGYGLRSVRDSFEESTIYSWAYLCTKAALRSSLNLFVSMVNRGKRCLVRDALGILKSYKIKVVVYKTHSTVILDEVEYIDAKSLARQVVSLMRTANINRRYECWQELTRAGRVLRSTSGIDLTDSFLWFKEGKLSAIAVRNVLAAQEGCLLTIVHPAFKNNNGDKSCRACKKTTETIEHVISSCTKWLSNLYIDRDDSVPRNVHYKLCQLHGLPNGHYTQKVDPVLENDSTKLYWNEPVQTKAIIRHNKPDIIVFDKIKRTALIIEIAVSWFTGISRQKAIKENRYCVNGNREDDLALPYPWGDNLQREMQTAGWKVSFLPIIIGAIGEVLSELKPSMMTMLGLTKEQTEYCIERMQRSAVLGTSRIIKNHLALQG
ncbi:unnamed protein product [Rotaria socialis]|uniref:Reverse transcriptase domain-containing protein n=2 Tax=Rotaria socialis TaxID=392032 RepID=A0A818ZN96_9BILA|nr:unnamed protein product [Rotaria socialis]